ncbi:MAG: trigger factor [Actinobacteria bacterium]|nr:trigger factor [Actinomycetota bacterium]
MSTLNVTSTVEELDDNKVKLHVEVDEATFEVALGAAFKKIGREVNMPGFRPGKVPRRVLEAKIGVEYARAEAIQDALGSYYAAALRNHDVDAIAQPEIDIESGEEDGPIVFDAEVEVRAVVEVSGYDALEVQIPNPIASNEAVDSQIDSVRGQSAELVEVDREAADGDHVTIDIAGTSDGEPLPGLVADDYSYEVGSGAAGEELDQHITGASAGDVLDFSAEHPVDEDTTIDFHVEVHSVKERVLPDLTDEWVDDNSEFDTVDEMRADAADRLNAGARVAANRALREGAATAAADLVDAEISEALVDSEMHEQIQNVSYSLQMQGISLEQWLMFNGKTQEEFSDDLKVGAAHSAKVDLALRAIAVAEGLWPSDTDIDDELERVAVQLSEKPAAVRARLTATDNLLSLKADLAKKAALEWLVDHVAIVDADSGDVIDRSLLEDPDDESTGADDEVPAAAGADETVEVDE